MCQRTLPQPTARLWLHLQLLLPVTQWRIWRCILVMLTNMAAHIRYLPLFVLPQLQQQQSVTVQSLQHLHPESPSPSMEHNKQDTQLQPYCTICGINVARRYTNSNLQYVRRPTKPVRCFFLSRWCTLHLRQVFIFLQRPTHSTPTCNTSSKTNSNSDQLPTP